MPDTSERRHLRVEGETPYAQGLSRGRQLRELLPEAYAHYAELFRALGVTAERESEGVERTLEVLRHWRPALVEELRGIAEAAGVELAHVVALNARTEILATGSAPPAECSTVTATIDGRRVAMQTWDWHIDLDPYWHTQEVAGQGHRYAGLSECGILSKIGVNEAGLALHFNILGHRADGPGGVPMHLLSAVVLSECASVEEAIALIRAAPIGSSSALTILDETGAVSLELSPVGVFEIGESDGSVQRTNHFQHPAPLAGQKSELYEPDSSERLELLRQRLAAGAPRDTSEMVALLVSGEGEPPLTCLADLSMPVGERWATLATVLTDPTSRTVSVFDGNPVDAARPGAQPAWCTLAV